jgi:hypothetical protein
MQVIEQQVQSNNATLFERIIDKEIFDRVYKGVRQQLTAPAAEIDVGKLVTGEVML